MRTVRTPNASEWEAIQGGQPIVLENPSSSIFEIIHAYEDSQESYIGPLAIVPTSREQLMGTVLVHLALPSAADDVVTPAALIWKYHGEPCEQRSQQLYDRLRANTVDAYVFDRLNRGWSAVSTRSFIEKLFHTRCAAI